MPGDRHLAAAVQAGIHRPLGTDAQGRLGMVQGGDQGIDARVVRAALDADGALGDGGQAVRRGDGALSA
jgi:hypothetical protein